MHLRCAFLIVLTLFLLAAQSHSGVWRVAPIRVDLDRTMRSTVVRISNSGNEPIRIQVQTVAWEQSENGEDIYTETSDLLAFPKIATVQPNDNQVIRVGIKRPAVQTEKTYRLFVQEIPQASPDGGASVSVSLRIGIPVFSAPLQTKISGSLDDIQVNRGTLSFSSNNSGNVTNKLEKLSIKGLDDSGQQIFSHNYKPHYLLPGTRILRELKLPQGTCDNSTSLMITADGDKLDLEEEVRLDKAMCN